MAATTSQPVGNRNPAPNPNIDKPLRDLRQEVTDNIVQMLERGVAPWQKPWDPAHGSFEMPFNPTSDRAYRGGNALHLMATGLQRGYQDPRWMTYKQAADQGWQIRRGEKGTQIEYWDVKPASEKNPADGTRDAADSAKPRLIHRVYTVFNAQQIDRIPEHAAKEHTAFEAVQAGEQILKNSGANIAHDQADRAFYSRSEDSIHLPPKDAFKDAGGYYGTALHELAHWSGHPSRLDRATLTESYRFGDVNYAREELRAELASVFLAGLAVALCIVNHVAYPGDAKPPDGWIAINTHFGDLSEPFRDFEAAQFIQQKAEETSARVLILPEAVVPRWSEATEAFWQRTLDRCRARGHTLAIGAGLPARFARDDRDNLGDLRDYDFDDAIEALNGVLKPAIRVRRQTPTEPTDNAILIVGGESGRFYQRVPVPVGMWRPFDRTSVPLRLASPGVLMINHQRAAVLICYEQMLTFPILVSMFEHPTVIVAISNTFWVDATTIPSYEATAVCAWARLFRLPYLAAANS